MEIDGTWIRIMEFRWEKTERTAERQQLWRNDKGEEKWVKVEILCKALSCLIEFVKE